MSLWRQAVFWGWDQILRELILVSVHTVGEALNSLCVSFRQKALTALGLTIPWDQKMADFSGVSAKSQGKLHLGSVLHWASLELGAKAGEGDTDLEDENVGKPKLFYADHSFIVLVRDNVSGALLLMGALDHAEGEALHDEL